MWPNTDVSDLMSWKGKVAHWTIRVICALMLCIAVNILTGANGWEEDFDPPLSIREKKLVRSGVLFEMCFQAGFWMTMLVISEMVTAKVHATQCVCMGALMLFCGPYGLPTWLYYGDGKDDPQYKQDVIASAIILCYVMVSVLVFAAYCGFTEVGKKQSQTEVGKKQSQIE